MMKKRVILFILGIALPIPMMFGIVPSALAHSKGCDVVNDSDARIYAMLGETPVYPDNTEEKS